MSNSCSVRNNYGSTPAKTNEKVGEGSLLASLSKTVSSNWSHKLASVHSTLKSKLCPTNLLSLTFAGG